jgi:hypothetical protein
MNCIIYGTTCEYTSAWSSHGGGAKRKEGSETPATASRVRKKAKQSLGGQSSTGDGAAEETTSGHSNAEEGSTSSTSPHEEQFDPGDGAEGGVESSDPVQIVGVDSQPSGVLEQNVPKEKLLTRSLASSRDNYTVLVHDQLGKKLVHYLTPMMTGVDNDEDIALSAEDAGLPPRIITETMVQGERSLGTTVFRVSLNIRQHILRTSTHYTPS